MDSLYRGDNIKPLYAIEKRNDLEHSSYAAFISDESVDDDADYKPVLQGVINTRCNYDGAKIEGSLEQ